jgi:hypothetical protein
MKADFQFQFLVVWYGVTDGQFIAQLHLEV